MTSEKRPLTGDTEDHGGLSNEPSFGKELDAGGDRSTVKRRLVTPGTVGPKLKQRPPRGTAGEGGA